MTTKKNKITTTIIILLLLVSFLNIISTTIMARPPDNGEIINTDEKDRIPHKIKIKILSLPATDITDNSAVLNGVVNSEDSMILICGFQYSIDNNWNDEDNIEVIVGSVQSGDQFSTTITGLTSNTEYYFRAFGYLQIQQQQSSKIIYGKTLSFTTLSENIPPIANIDIITPNPADEHTIITFRGTAEDLDGFITLCEWNSDIDGFLSSDEGFKTDRLSPGVHTISFRAQDNNGAWSSEDTETLVVNQLNTPPFVSDIPDETIDEGQIFTEIYLDDYVEDLEDSDEDITWSYSGNNQLIVAINNRIASIRTPQTDWTGSETITFTATDTGGLFDFDSATFTVNNVNHIPVAKDDQYTTNEDEILYISEPGILDNDYDDDDDLLSIILLDTVDNGYLDLRQNGSFIYNPNIDFYGTDSFIYCLNDSFSDSNIAVVTINIDSVNDAPVVDDIPDQIVDEGQVFADIYLDNYVSDVEDLDEEIIWSYNGNIELSINIVDRVATVIIPNENWYGSETITFTATDTDGAFDSDSAVFTVNNVNDDPVAVDDLTSVFENSGYHVIDVLDNDYDFENDPLTITSVFAGSDFENLQIEDNLINFTINADFYGSTFFIYNISDNNSGVDSAYVYVTVEPVNSEPVAVDDMYNISEDSNDNIFDVITNDYDTDNDSIIISSIVTQPDHGLVTHDEIFIYYTPDENYFGSDYLVYSIVDDNGSIAVEATVNIIIKNVNDDPVAVDDNASVIEDSNFTQIDVMLNDYDNDSSDNLTINGLISSPSSNYSIYSDGGYVYFKPDSDFYGLTSFGYTITDENSMSSSAMVYVNVTSVNDEPVASFLYTKEQCDTISFVDNSNDIDGNIVSWYWDFGDGNTSTEQNPYNVFEENGEYNVVLTATDDEGATDSYQEIITINCPPHGGGGGPAPNISPLADFSYSPINETVDEIVYFTDLSFDPDGYIISWSWDFGDGNTSTLQNPSHQFTLSGNYSVSLTVLDNESDYDSIIKYVNVNPSSTENDNDTNETDGTPVAYYSYSPASPTTEDTVVFTDGSTDNGTIVNWTWVFDDGTISFEQNTSHIFSTAGSYNVNLTVVDNDGNNDSYQTVISVSNPPSEDPETPPSTNTGGGGGGGAPPALAVDGPESPVISGPSYAKPGVEYKFNFSSKHPKDQKVRFKIDWGDGTVIPFGDYYKSSEEIVFTHVFEEGSFDITAQSRDLVGTKSEWSEPFTIDIYNEKPEDEKQDNDVNSSPVVYFLHKIDGSDNGLVYFSGISCYDPDGTIVNYSWDFGDGSFGFGINVTHVYSESGTYFVTLNVVDDDGLSNSSTIKIVVDVVGSNPDVNVSKIKGYTKAEGNVKDLFYIPMLLFVIVLIGFAIMRYVPVIQDKKSCKHFLKHSNDAFVIDSVLLPHGSSAKPVSCSGSNVGVSEDLAFFEPVENVNASSNDGDFSLDFFMKKHSSGAFIVDSNGKSVSSKFGHLFDSSHVNIFDSFVGRGRVGFSDDVAKSGRNLQVKEDKNLKKKTGKRVNSKKKSSKSRSKKKSSVKKKSSTSKKKSSVKKKSSKSKKTVSSKSKK